MMCTSSFRRRCCSRNTTTQQRRQERISSTTIKRRRLLLFGGWCFVLLVFLGITFDLLQDFNFDTYTFIPLLVAEEEEEEEEEELMDLYYTNLNATIATWDYFPKRRRMMTTNHRPSSYSEETTTTSSCSSFLQTEDFSTTSSSSNTQRTTTSCDGYDGVLLISRGDRGGASGTIFFLYVISMLRWCEQHNYKPWIHFNPYSQYIYDPIVHSSTNNTDTITFLQGMEIEWARDENDPIGYTFPGRPLRTTESLVPHNYSLKDGTTGVWEHYFEPISSSDIRSCAHKPLVEMSTNHLLPGLHSLSPWTPQAWRYSSSPFITNTTKLTKSNVSFRNWIQYQREVLAVDIVQRYIQFKPTMERRVRCILYNTTSTTTPKNTLVLGLHIRHGDKAPSRKRIPVIKFLSFCKAFVQILTTTNTTTIQIYVATDSSLVWNEIHDTWPKYITQHLIRQPNVRALSSSKKAAFEQTTNNSTTQHRSTIEALTDLLALSKCHYLIHGWSALTEAAIYLNPQQFIQQRNNTVDLDDHELSYQSKLRTFTDTLVLQQQSTTRA